MTLYRWVRPTNNPPRAVLAEFNCRSYTRRGRMACPGLRRAWIGITDVPGMRIGTRTVTPATMVPLGTCRNSNVHPTTTVVNIDIRHHRQVRKGIQCQGQQLLPTLIATIQWDSRGHHGGLVLRAGIAVQRPSRQPLTCQGVRPPAVLTCLVIRDRHSRRHSRRGSTDHLVSLSTPTHIIQQWCNTYCPRIWEVTGGWPSRGCRTGRGCRPGRHGWPVTGCRPGTDGQLSGGAGVTRHRTSLQLGHRVTPCHVWCHGMTIRHQIRCQWHISVQQATKMYQWIRRLLFSGPFPSTSTRCSLLTSWLWWIQRNTRDSHGISLPARQPFLHPGQLSGSHHHHCHLVMYRTGRLRGLGLQ